MSAIVITIAIKTIGRIGVLLCFVFPALIASAQKSKPDFSGIWILDAARSGPEPAIWLQRRPVRFDIHQTNDEITIDTNDGSLFGVTDPVTESPLRYRLDGSVVTILDMSLGDLPNFERRIRTEASWKNDSRLVTYTTHFAETSKGANDGNTRVLILSVDSAEQVLQVDRTGYRGSRPDLSTLFGPLPKYLHNGRLEDDRAYAKDTAYYKKAR